MQIIRAAVITVALCAARALELRRGVAEGGALVEGPVSVSSLQNAGHQVFPNVSRGKSQGAATAPLTFPGFYDGHATGRGIWKWGNALAAYQRHFGGLAGHAVSIAEIGVQSGGSLLMWRGVLGEKCHVHGLDINPACRQFQDAHTTITIGDQGSPEMWSKFFGTTCKSLDILIDDGGHEPHQMLTTLKETFPELNPGGFISIEDIHGEHYLASFFQPASRFLARQGESGRVASVHVYPFVLIVHKAGKLGDLPPQKLSFSGTSVDLELPGDMESLLKELPKHRGKTVAFSTTKAWGPLLTEANLYWLFQWFQGLHHSVWQDSPPGCAHTSAAVCTTTVTNSELQALVTGVHVYPAKVVVEVAGRAPVIEAVRRGDKFISYG